MNKTLIDKHIIELSNKYFDYDEDTIDLILHGFFKRHNYLKTDRAYFIPEFKNKIIHNSIIRSFAGYKMQSKKVNKISIYDNLISKISEIKGFKDFFSPILLNEIDSLAESLDNDVKSLPQFEQFILDNLINIGRTVMKVDYLVNEEIENSIIDDKTELIEVSPKQTEIIIALNELGILDFLRDKHPHLKMSSNRLANVIHLITGNQTESLVSNINTLYSPKQKQSKNNPYSSEKVVKKVKDRLDNQLKLI